VIADTRDASGHSTSGARNPGTAVHNTVAASTARRCRCPQMAGDVRIEQILIINARAEFYLVFPAERLRSIDRLDNVVTSYEVIV
jgi:hypothetical protein